MEAWSQFYGTLGGASAALLGLLFVAVSVNAPAALGRHEPASSRLTEQVFQNYLTVMMVSLLALFPGIGAATFGRVTLLATASWSLFVVVRLYQTITQRLQRRSWTAIRRHAASVIGFGILLASALCMATGWADTHNLLAASSLTLLFSATAVSWELLKRIANQGRPS
jgi:hypothetical protein